MRTIKLTFDEAALLQALLANAIMDTGSNKAAALYKSIYRKVVKTI